LNSRGLVKRYYFYLAKLFMLILVGFAVFITNSTFYESAADSFKAKQDQIYFADQTQVKISLTVVASQGLYSSNNTAQVKNMFAEDEVVRLLSELVQMKQKVFQIVNEIPERDLASQITTLFFDDSCTLLDSTMDLYCQILKSKGQKTGVIYMIDALEFILESLLQVYENSVDKSAELLKQLGESNIELVTSLFLVADAASGKAAGLVNESFENRGKDVAFQTLLMLIISIIVIGIVGVLFWKLLLEELRDGVVRFKNVLKVLPPELVLSSFILKTFLVKTSKGLLETIKHEL